MQAAQHTLRAMDDEYTPLDALVRLQSLQALCSGVSGVDGILCVAGIDGGDNLGASQIVKYLLMGCSGSELLAGNIGNIDFEDVAMVITGSGLSVYCNARVFPKIKDLTALWRGLKTYVLTLEEMKDADAAEDFKIASFISMVSGCQRLGISVGTADIGQAAGSVVEQWPLVQAYGLDGPGSPGALKRPWRFL